MPFNLTLSAFMAGIIGVGGQRNNLVNGRGKMHDPLAASARLREPHLLGPAVNAKARLASIEYL
jgi:hypothetical protein